MHCIFLILSWFCFSGGCLDICICLATVYAILILRIASAWLAIFLFLCWTCDSGCCLDSDSVGFSWDAADKVVSQDWDCRAMLKGKAHPLFSIYQRCWILIWIKSTFLLFRFRGNIWSESFFQWLTSMTNISKSREDIVGSIPISNKVQLSATDV